MPTVTPVIRRPVLALPEHEVSLDEVLEHLAREYADSPNLDRALRAVRACGVKTRRYSRPLTDLAKVSVGERVRWHFDDVCDLSEAAARRALDEAGLTPMDVRTLITATSAGYVMPGLDGQALYGRVLTHGERIAGPFQSAGLNSFLPARPPLPPRHVNLLFVTVPDVPFDAAATAIKFAEWAPLISHLQLALCVQDGAGDIGIPWNRPGMRCLFMAGSDSYKMSSEIAGICREGKSAVYGFTPAASTLASESATCSVWNSSTVSTAPNSTSTADTHIGWGLREAARVTYQPQLLLNHAAEVAP